MKASDQNITIKWLFWVIPGVLILGITPFLIGYLFTPPDKSFSGALINPDDLSVYLSAMRQGENGRWLFDFQFSPEPIQARFTYPLYIALGHLNRIFGGEPLFWYHGLRIMGGIFTTVTFWYLVRTVFPGNATGQKTALILLAFGSGVGWLFTPIIPADSLLLADINVPEWNLVTSLLSSPHFVMGIGLESLLISILIQRERGNESGKLLISGILIAIGIGLTFPFHIPTFGLIVGVYFVGKVIQTKRIPWKQWLAYLLILSPFILYLTYYGAAALTDPSWAESHIDNNVIEPPPLLGLFIGSGILGIFALLGIREWVKQKRTLIIPLWIFVNATVIYIPVSFSGRLLLGLFIPVTTLAAFSLEEIVLPKLKASAFYERFAKLTPTPYESLRRVLIILTLPTTLLVTLWVIRNTITFQDFPNYYPGDEVQAAQWLAENSDEGALVLAHYPMGNYLPRVISGKVYVGHLNLTIDLDEKLEAVETFWDKGTKQEWREAFLSDEGISIIYYGKYERLLGEISITPHGEVIYENSSVTIYSVAE